MAFPATPPDRPSNCRAEFGKLLTLILGHGRRGGSRPQGTPGHFQGLGGRLRGGGAGRPWDSQAMRPQLRPSSSQRRGLISGFQALLLHALQWGIRPPLPGVRPWQGTFPLLLSYLPAPLLLNLTSPRKEANAFR